MLPGNQDQITKPIKGRRGRPKKMDDGRLDQIMNEYVVQPQSGQECRAIMGDAGIAEDIEKKHGVRLSPDFVYRYRKKRNIRSCYGHGGFRTNEGRPSKFTEEYFEQMMPGFLEVKGGKKITRLTDAEIAGDIKKRYGEEISEETIRCYRLSHNISACHGKHGGKRSGAGRPKEDELPPAKKGRNTHKLTIGDYSMVRACPTAYNFVQGVWNASTGQYDKLARYVPRFRQDGLKSYTPILPYPDRYSKAQKFKGLEGQ